MNRAASLSPLATELEKRNAFRSVEEEVYINLLRTRDVLSVRFGELFESAGLSETLYNVLRIVAGEQEVAPEGVAIGTITRRMVCRQPDTTRLVDRLVRLGYVEKSCCLLDTRRRLVKLTAAGRATLEQLRLPVERLHGKQFENVPPDELHRLNGLLDKVRASVNET